ncbi:hypothetical protein [Desulfonatronospira sp.]|uniref:DUF6812 domain-containing protein n=1 Tax=Desulfonatronospira sp. TaxID=1962951 RepID=UPI0025B8B2A3|nr:hypothetical protein [Desulfonatronospira sp.]
MPDNVNETLSDQRNMEVRTCRQIMADYDSKQAILKLVDGTSIKGWINLKSSTRLSDVLTEYDDRFIVIFRCALREELGNVLFVNKEHILWVAPVDNNIKDLR